MAETEVYAIIGGLMAACFVIGGAMTANVYSPPEIKAVGGLIILGGFVLLLILLGIGGYHMWKWYSGWSLERRSDELDRKMERMRIKEREDEVKDREREYWKEKQKREETRKQETRSYSTTTDTRSAQPYQPPTKQQVQDTKTESKSPTQNLEKPKQVSEDEPILKTGGGVSSNLQKKTEEIESHETSEPIEKESDQEEYVRYVKRDPILRSLWYLYNSKEGFFLGQTEAARIIYEIEEGDEVSGSRRQEVKATMKELEYYGLITATVIKTDIKKKPFIEYKIMPKGKDLMKRAINENVRRWGEFVEKYSGDLQDRR